MKTLACPCLLQKLWDTIKAVIRGKFIVMGVPSLKKITGSMSKRNLK
jgi:hypothetical protein